MASLLGQSVEATAAAATPPPLVATAPPAKHFQSRCFASPARSCDLLTSQHARGRTTAYLVVRTGHAAIPQSQQPTCGRCAERSNSNSTKMATRQSSSVTSALSIFLHPTVSMAEMDNFAACGLSAPITDSLLLSRCRLPLAMPNSLR